MPRRRPDSSASARRRFASAPPPIDWWPASPLVTETNFTAAPISRNLAAVPAARISQSSGCAPKAITRNGASCASSATAGSSRPKPKRSMSDIAELILPNRLALLVQRRTPQDREQGADGRALGDVLHFAVLNAREESLNGIVGDVARGVYGLRVFRAFVVNHARARRFDHALGAGELLADARESRRANLISLEIHMDAVGKLEREGEMIQNLHRRAYLSAGHAHGANGARVEEPVQHVEIVAVLLHDEIAGVIPVAEPVAQVLDFGVVVRRALERIAADPERTRVDQFADLAFADPLEGFQVDWAVALLESDGDVLLGIGFAAGGDDRLHAFQIHAHGLLAVDVLAGFDGGGQHARVLEGRRGDDYGIQI